MTLFRYIHIYFSNIHCSCGYTIELPHCIEAVLSCTHDLYFQPKEEKKIMYTPCLTSIKVEFGGLS